MRIAPDGFRIFSHSTLVDGLMPPAPVHASENVVPTGSGPTLCDPLVDFAPLQPPYAVHVVALEELQVSTEEPPAETIVGFAVMVASGTTLTVTLAALLAPPAAAQVSV